MGYIKISIIWDERTKTIRTMTKIGLKHTTLIVSNGRASINCAAEIFSNSIISNAANESNAPRRITGQFDLAINRRISVICRIAIE